MNIFTTRSNRTVQSEASEGGATLGLTLSGGGARGGAHIGALIELYQMGLAPDLITGASIGGMIGALIAFGLTIDELVEFFDSLNVSTMYAIPETTHSVVGNSRIEKLLEDRIGRPRFEDLKIPLALSTTDLVSRSEVILDRGDLISAVLATIALPLLLPPVERNGRVLIDGGVLNNTPFDIARARGASHVLAIDLTLSAPYGTPADDGYLPRKLFERILGFTQRHKTWQVAAAVIDTVVSQNMRTRLATMPPDILLQPPIDTIGILDFHRWDEGIRIGRKAVVENRDKFSRLPTLTPPGSGGPS